MAAKRAECSTLAAILFLATAAFGQAGVSLIAGGTVVTMDDGYRVVEGGALAVEKNRIVSDVEPSVALPEADERIDAAGMLVIPADSTGLCLFPQFLLFSSQSLPRG
jgi:imidazolonepropionase-like amidohydrolase